MALLIGDSIFARLYESHSSSFHKLSKFTRLRGGKVSDVKMVLKSIPSSEYPCSAVLLLGINDMLHPHDFNEARFYSSFFEGAGFDAQRVALCTVRLRLSIGFPCTVLCALEKYCGAKEKEVGKSAAPQQKGGRGRRSYKKGKAKRTRFAQAQNLFKVDKRALAKHALTGTPLGERVKVAAPREQIQDLYNKLWGVKSTCRVEPLREPAERIPIHQFGVITADNVKTRLQRMAADTAPGRDGLKKTALMGGTKAVILAAFYNLVLAWGVWPSEWRTNRTTLLPKEGKDPLQATNYRPLTISSTINRVFMGILDGRIRSLIKIHPRQKGFVAEPGCYQNIQILDQAIRVMKQQGGVGIQLDVSKAFDTVPHEPILQGKGIPRHIIQLVLESYRDTKTSIAMEGGDILVEIVRGVKQGDPMSPLLFILMIEPLLERLENMEGLGLSGEKVCSLAFADDLYLLAKDAASAQALMDETARSLKDLGMSLSASKSFAFQYCKAPGKSFGRVDPGIKILGEAIPQARPEDVLTYLGVSVSPWRDGVTLKGFEGRVGEALRRLKALALKPEQKLLILKENLMSHWQYQLTAAGPTRAFLKRVDSIIRSWTKELLRLPSSTTTWLFYSRCADGGLGLQCYEDSIPRYILSQGLKLRTSKDALCRAVGESDHYTERLQNAARKVRVEWPSSEKEITKAKHRQQKGYLRAWSMLKAQGKAVQSFRGDGIGNCWLRDPSLLKSSRLITALQMRANVCADKVSLSKIRQNAGVMCRKCKVLPETLGHILGQCLETKSDRLARHDEIKHFINQRMTEKGGTEVMLEERLRLPNGEVRQPDLIVKNQKGAFVVDVTVRIEGNGFTQLASKSKLERYAPTLPQVRQIFSAQNAQVLPIVVGARGALPKTTQRALKMLGISSRSDLQTIALMALRASIETYHRFIDYDKRPYLRTGQPDEGEEEA
ncbi:Retrovirus-related Pol polyprotein from type-1 retrotransposable element R2 [Frankliniella fusca]|uniref:Retrovirus-related Pol polyprotein from type-1 retrotransposable element R2 n=1 Tax=Frankliniella fusca TaxID=407009 RepID=A0AAE1LK09_9NEOP|nr:Retrovirus-related Pol polyprotein from type-1 retrotransposable element R2 [Frankliniella fusca]